MGDIFDTIETKGQKKKVDIFDTLDAKGDIFDQVAITPVEATGASIQGELPVSGGMPPPVPFIPQEEPLTQYPSAPYERQPAVVPPSEIIKAGKRGLFGVGEQMGKGIKYIGEEIEAADITPGAPEYMKPPIRLSPESFKEVGEEIQEFYRKGREKKELKMSPELAKKPWYNPKKFTATMAEALPLTVAGMGAGALTTIVTKNPYLGASVTSAAFGTVSAASTFEELTEAGVPEDEALMWSRTAGTGEFFIEILPGIMFMKLLKKMKLSTEALKEGGDVLAKSIEVAKSMGKLALAESLEEGAQTVKDNLIARQTYDPERPLLKDVPEAMALGGVMGLGLGAAGRLAGGFEAPITQKEQVLMEKPEPEIEEIKTKLTETSQFKRWFSKSNVADKEGRPLTVYHGTISNIKKFSPSFKGAVTGAESAKEGYFFTDSPEVATSYSNYAATDAKVKKLLDEGRDAEKKGDFDTSDAKLLEAEQLEDAFRADFSKRQQGQNIMPVFLSIKNPLVIDAKGEFYSAIEDDITAKIKEAKESPEYDGVIIKNLDDAPGLVDIIADHYVVFKPSQIKSVFEPEPIKKVAKKEVVPRGTEPDDLIEAVNEALTGFFVNTETGELSLKELNQAVGDITASLKQASKEPSEIRESINEALTGHLDEELLQEATKDVANNVLAELRIREEEPVKKVTENGVKEKEVFRAKTETEEKEELLRVEREAQKPEELTRESVDKEEVVIENNIAKLTKSQQITLDRIAYDVEQGEAGSRRKGFAIPSTFPIYFQNKSYTKKETLRAIDLAKAREPLGTRQSIIIEDLVFSARMEEAIENERLTAKEGEVAEHIGDVKPTIGLAIKKATGKEDIRLRNIINAKKEKFKFPDKETEKRFSASRGVKKETAITKTRQFLGDLKNRFTRTFEHLPRTGEFARLQFDILKLQKQKGVASDKTLRNIQSITIKLDNMEYDLFGRKVILDDLVETAEKGKDLPFGFTPETLEKSKTLLETELEKTPRVMDAVKKRTKFWDDIKEQYIPAMKDIGVDVSERLQNKNYFRHQVLEYASLKSSVKGTPVKKPKHRGFLKQRKGSLLDINTDYIQAEHEVMAQMLYDIEVAKTMKTITDKYDISKTVRKDAKEQGITDWREAVPEGYTIWQPDKGNSFFMADSIPSSLASKLENGALKELGLKKEDIRKVMAVGGKQQELVVKEEVAKTLEDLEKTSKEAGIVKLDREIHRRWKMWVLVSPRRWFKYNFRNITGDADALFVGNPAAFLKVPQAVAELYETMFHDKPMTENLRAWFERGGIASTLQAQEMGELNQLKIFVDIHNKEQAGKSTLPIKMWKGYWKAARLTTDFREAIFRYAAFLDYIEQINKSKEGKPKNFGASKPEEIMALEDTKDKAYWLQNDLLGAYDRVSVTGQNLASFWYPFWRWKEVNFRRYTQFIKNAVNDKKLAETVGRKLLFGITIKSPLIAIRVGKFAIKATAFWSMIQAWNILMFPDEEDELSNEEKSRLHIIFGRDKDGKIIYFTRLGALGDFLAWFGLDGAPGLVSDYLNGRRTMKETAIEMAKSPVNAIAQGATPLVKMPLELTTGKSLFPDVTSPRAIRDKGLHFARGFGLAAEYKAMAGLPSRPYKESLDNILAYKADPLQVAYYDILELKYRFLDKIGRGRSGSVVTPRGQALYNLKLAVRYEDKEAFKKYFEVYASYGGTPEDLVKALERLHPLTGLRHKKKGKIVLAPEGIAFLSTLSNEDQEKLVKAEKFYNTVLQGKPSKTKGE